MVLVLKPKAKPESPRTELRQFLEKQLALIENSESPQSAGLALLLRQAVEGLTALDYREVQTMFAKKGAKDGAKPYTLRRLQMRGLGFADLLIANKYRGDEPAIRTVAEAYGERADAFRKWRNRSKLLGKTKDSLMKSFREEISKLAWDEAHVLAELKKAGAEYQFHRNSVHGRKGSG